MSVPRREMPHSRPSGTKPNGHRPVRKSSASAASSGSGSNGRLRGILIAAMDQDISEGLEARTAADSGVIGAPAQRGHDFGYRQLRATPRELVDRASHTAAAQSGPHEHPEAVGEDADQQPPATIFSAIQPAHRLGVANCASSKPSIRVAIWPCAAARRQRQIRTRGPYGLMTACSSAVVLERLDIGQSSSSARTARELASTLRRNRYLVQIRAAVALSAALNRRVASACP